MSKPDTSTRPNHGEHTETIPGSRSASNPAGSIRVRRPPDQVAEIKPGTRGVVTGPDTDAKLTVGDITRRARGR
jgi:hypothetical protein